MMTGFGSMDTAVDAMKAGAFDYLSKPFKFDEIKLALKRAVEKKESLAAARTAGPAAPAPRAPVDGRPLAGDGGGLQDDRQGRAGQDDRPRPRRERHRQGAGRPRHPPAQRAGREAVHRHHCAALPDTLLESELFGYAKGAHSTATADKAGLFEQAKGGTLFLDEIGDTTLSLQAKLLRVLEESEARRLGDLRTYATDVRIVASTNQDLQALIREEKFRSDLYYRLNVITVALPPLRERRRTSPTWPSSSSGSTARDGQGGRGGGGDASDLFQKYSWPGNVRELENVVERAVTLNTKSRIMAEDCPNRSAGPRPRSVVVGRNRTASYHARASGDQGNMKAAAAVLASTGRRCTGRRPNTRSTSTRSGNEDGGIRDPGSAVPVC